MNTQMLQFHRGLQSLESDIFTQTISLRQHLWKLEMVIEQQVSKQTNTDNKEPISGIHWPQWEIGSEQDEPLFNFRLSTQQLKMLLHRQITAFIQDINQVNGKSVQHNNRWHNRRTFKLNQDVEQFNQAVDEHLFGLHNDVKRLESVVEEQIFELHQDIDFLKTKIDVSWSRLQQFLLSQTSVVQSDLQSDWQQSSLFTSWQTLRQYVRCIDGMASRNMSNLRQEVGFLRIVIYEDMSLLHQSARSFQLDVCGESSYKYNRFLRRR